MKSFSEFVGMREGVFNINDPSFLQSIQGIADPAERQRMLAFYQQHRAAVNQNAAQRQKNFANADTMVVQPPQKAQPQPVRPQRKLRPEEERINLGEPGIYQKIMAFPQPARDYWLGQLRRYNANQKPIALDHFFHGILP